MGRPKGSKNATNRVAVTKSPPQKAARAKNGKGNDEARPSVSRGTTRIRRPRKTSNGKASITSRHSNYARAVRKSRASATVKKAPEVIGISKDEKEAIMLLGFIIVVSLLFGVFLGRMLP